MRTIVTALAVLLGACASVVDGDPPLDAGEDAAPPPPGTPPAGLTCVADGDLAPAVPPGDVAVAGVEVNPGVAIALWDGAAEVPLAARNAYLPARREALVRAYVEPGPAFAAPRTLEARLRLEFAGGTASGSAGSAASGGSGGGGGEGGACTYVTTALIAGATEPGDLASGFQWRLPAADLQPGTRWAVELSEPEGGAAPPAPLPVRVPAAGTLDLGVEDADTSMRTVLVPVDYSYGACARLPDTSPERVAELAASLYQQYPIESIDMTVRAPMPWTTALEAGGDLGTLLYAMIDLRTADGAPEDVHYYGLYDVCAPCVDNYGIGCIYGMAAGDGPFGMVSALGRNAVGQDGARALWTIAHEAGHMHGRSHVACPDVDAGGTDGAYPYANGSIGRWGFGVLDGLLRDPATHRDFMTLCESTWVSDYTWNGAFERILVVNE